MRNAQHRHWAASGASGFGEPLATLRRKPGGLSLARAIADLHGASMTLEDNKPGVKVVASFPAIGNTNRQ
ncbi:hypothetical protein [Aminobacter aminovorans]|uniref:hypothetical protein n=1 Tax=Aminobacter aminovorans TaxID=83263 RepID=UPI00104F1141|nr:hypothetical protein [Aminobacter aminovorans]